MEKAKFFLAVVLAFVAACSSGADDGSQNSVGIQVSLPPKSDLTYTESSNGKNYFKFEGELVLTGVIVAYWQAKYLEAEPTRLDQAEPVREMYLRFYPDEKSQYLLPSFERSSAGTTRHDRIFLYRDRKSVDLSEELHSAYNKDDESEIKSLVANFTEVPDNFLNYREGYILQSATVSLNNLISFVEGDYLFLYARMEAFELLPLTDSELFEIPDFDAKTYLGKPWSETFYAPDRLVIRESPYRYARTVSELPPGAFPVVKQRTVDENWVLVEVVLSEDERISGYVEKSALMVVN